MPFSGWIEGTSEEVICLGFMLNIGNIREPVDSSYRKELIYSMYAQNQWEQDEEIEELKKCSNKGSQTDWGYSWSFATWSWGLVVCQKNRVLHWSG